MSDTSRPPPAPLSNTPSSQVEAARTQRPLAWRSTELRPILLDATRSLAPDTLAHSRVVAGLQQLDRLARADADDTALLAVLSAFPHPMRVPPDGPITGVPHALIAAAALAASGRGASAERVWAAALKACAIDEAVWRDLRAADAVLPLIASDDARVRGGAISLSSLAGWAWGKGLYLSTTVALQEAARVLVNDLFDRIADPTGPRSGAALGVRRGVVAVPDWSESERGALRPCAVATAASLLEILGRWGSAPGGGAPAAGRFGLWAGDAGSGWTSLALSVRLLGVLGPGAHAGLEESSDVVRERCWMRLMHDPWPVPAFTSALSDTTITDVRALLERLDHVGRVVEQEGPQALVGVGGIAWRGLSAARVRTGTALAAHLCLSALRRARGLAGLGDDGRIGADHERASAVMARALAHGDVQLTALLEPAGRAIGLPGATRSDEIPTEHPLAAVPTSVVRAALEQALHQGVVVDAQDLTRADACVRQRRLPPEERALWDNVVLRATAMEAPTTRDSKSWDSKSGAAPRRM